VGWAIDLNTEYTKPYEHTGDALGARGHELPMPVFFGLHQFAARGWVDVMPGVLERLAKFSCFNRTVRNSCLGCQGKNSIFLFSHPGGHNDIGPHALIMFYRSATQPQVMDYTTVHTRASQ
jgi:hypothetical protein